MKPKFALVTEPEATALQLNGKYRPDRPHWVRRGEQVWVLVNEQWMAWRTAFTQGKRAKHEKIF